MSSHKKAGGLTDTSKEMMTAKEEVKTAVQWYRASYYAVVAGCCLTHYSFTYPTSLL